MTPEPRVDDVERPNSVTWISAGVLIIAIEQFAGLFSAFQIPGTWDPLLRAYLVIKAGLWGAVASIIAAGLFTGKSWAPAVSRASAIAISLWYWFDRFLLTNSPYEQITRVPAIILTALALGALFWLLQRPSVKSYFERSPND